MPKPRYDLPLLVTVAQLLVIPRASPLSQDKAYGIAARLYCDTMYSCGDRELQIRYIVQRLRKKYPRVSARLEAAARKRLADGRGRIATVNATHDQLLLRIDALQELARQIEAVPADELVQYKVNNLIRGIDTELRKLEEPLVIPIGGGANL